MIRPDEVEFLSFFECEPTFLDDISIVPFEYNFSTYTYRKNSIGIIEFKVSPADEIVHIRFQSNGIETSVQLNNVNQIEILYDQKEKAEMRIESDISVTKIALRPRLAINHVEGRNL